MTIKIEDLDEFEGTTADMVREYATKAGYGLSQAGLRAPNQGGFITFVNPMRDDAMSWLVECLAGRERRSVQSLLREINPRMRAGWPTDEELERHAFWLVGQPSIRVDLRVTSAKYVRAWRDRLDPEFKDIGRPVCWPCDQHGNKTRRGA